VFKKKGSDKVRMFLSTNTYVLKKKKKEEEEEEEEEKQGENIMSVIVVAPICTKIPHVKRYGPFEFAISKSVI
jgi:hypothetical protein